MNLRSVKKAMIKYMRDISLSEVLGLLGIILSVALIVAVMSIEDGGRKTLAKQFNNNNIYMIRLKNEEIQQNRNSNLLTIEDMNQLKEKIPSIKALIPMATFDGTINAYKRKAKVVLTATNDQYKKYANLAILRGRFMNEQDIVNEKSVVVIDDYLADSLFGTTDAVGKYVELGTGGNNIKAAVIGVYKNYNMDRMTTETKEFQCYYPITSMKGFNNSSNITKIAAAASQSVYKEDLIKEIIYLLEKNHGNKDQYDVNRIYNFDWMKLHRDKYKMNYMITVGLLLLAGGLGLTNVMHMLAKKRENEIKMCKLFGARYQDILFEYILEALILCMAASCVGIILGTLLSTAVGIYINISPSLSLSTLLVVLGYSAVVGVIFGFYPAKTAAAIKIE